MQPRPRSNPSRRAAIYARYSTDLQKDRSIDDQVALCRTHARKEGIEVTRVYSDRAQTSASIIGRDGLMQLMDDAKAGLFDMVIVEALDRVSRDQEDLAGIYKRLTFVNVDIMAVHDGVADAVQIGIRGLVGSLFMADLKHKVRRGLAGVVNDGRVAGGNAYGYDMVPGKPGERTINDEQAAVIRTIFDRYLKGYTPRDIARQLNDEGVPPPRGVRWNASTINGSKNRSYGILVNAIYGGTIVWNRVRMIRDPDTGRRISRFNHESEWKTAEAPHLAIVSREIFQAAQERKEHRSHGSKQGHMTRKPKRLLSGLLRCVYCGGGMSSQGNHGGGIRIKCSRYIESGTCDNSRGYRLDRIEKAVVNGLFEMVDNPEATAEHIRAYYENRREAINSATRNRSKVEKRLMDVTRELDRLIDALAKGLPAERIEVRTKELDVERQKLLKELEAAKEAVPVVDIHPTSIRRLQRTITRISEQLEEGEQITDPEVVEAIRSMISHIEVSDTANGGYQAEVWTYIASLTGEHIPNVWGGAMVAKEGFEPPTQGL